MPKARMVSLTTLAKWIPEDDLLLKNAVEAGASLKSLAKGAVCFSRRFTVRELQDRWRALLYDLDTSVGASTRILEIEAEHDATSSLQKANQTYIFRGKESSSWKRKLDSVQSHYHAMRKRIHTESGSANLGFLPPKFLAGAGCDNGSEDQLRSQNKQLVDNFSVGKPFSHNDWHQETRYDRGQITFPKLIRVNSAVTNSNVPKQSYHGQHVGLAEDKISDGTAGEGCLFGHLNNNPSVSLDEAGCNVGSRSFDHSLDQEDFSNILGENLISGDMSPDVHVIRQSNALGTSSVYKNSVNDVAEPDPLPAFDSTSDYHERSLCSDFIGNENLSSHALGTANSFPLEYSCTPSGMATWRSMDDGAAHPVPTDGQYGDKDQELLNIEEDKKTNAPGCDASEPKLHNGMCGARLNNLKIIPEDIFMDYIGFADDEVLLDVDEKDISDSPWLNSLNSILLSSPRNINQEAVLNINQDFVANSNDPGTRNISDSCLGTSDAVCSTEHDIDADTFEGIPLLGVAYAADYYHSVSVLGVNMQSTLLQTSNSTTSTMECFTCVLSIEDPEIPNNDHVIFPHERVPPYSTTEQCAKESTGLASSKPSKRKASTVDVIKVKEDVANVQPTISSMETDSLSLPKVDFLHLCDGHGVEIGSPKGSSVDDVCRYAGICANEPNLCTSKTVAMESPVAAFKEETIEPNFQNHDDPKSLFASFLEDHLQGIDHPRAYPPNKTVSCQKEANTQDSLQICLPSRHDPVSEMGHAVAIMYTSEQEEQHSESEVDVPYFSDIEALILDMDLAPYVEESCVLFKEVSRYQQMDIKSTSRWEQSFHSHMNRSILSHGAFAIFYGRRLKYFIKDSEVTLGRETEYTKVDIDLGREGRANKISRRQATIKMDEKGGFFLNNFGKFPIFVNGREVPAKKRINLLSFSLIEIKGMQFMFEVNEHAVGRYLKNLRQRSQEQPKLNGIHDSSHLF